MVTLNHYYLSYLPSIDELGQPIEIDSRVLLELLSSGGELTRAGRIVHAITLSDDLLKRESLLSGQVDNTEPSILSMEQMLGEQPLPDYLITADLDGLKGVSLTDTVWASFFLFAGKVAVETGGRFLQSWVEFEVSVRNSIATKRAETLELDPSGYIVAEELGGLDVDDIVSAWFEADTRNPRDGQKTLDSARWRWIEDHSGYYSFLDDELAAYAARLVISQRWTHINQETEQQEQD